MGNHALSNLLFLLNLATLLITSLAVPYCPPPKYPPKHHPSHPLPPRPPHVNPPKPHPPHISPPKSPVVKPPIVHPSPPYVPNPPAVPKPPSSPPYVPSPTPPAGGTCSIDTLKLGACVDLLGGLVHVGVGSSAKDTCCPVLQGLVNLDAAICLCTTIRAKLLNINIVLPIALQLLIDCGKTPPEGFKCPA